MGRSGRHIKCSELAMPLPLLQCADAAGTKCSPRQEDTQWSSAMAEVRKEKQSRTRKLPLDFGRIAVFVRTGETNEGSNLLTTGSSSLGPVAFRCQQAATVALGPDKQGAESNGWTRRLRFKLNEWLEWIAWSVASAGRFRKGSIRAATTGRPMPRPNKTHYYAFSLLAIGAFCCAAFTVRRLLLCRCCCYC